MVIFGHQKILTENLLGEIREVQFRYDRYRPVYGGKPHKEGSLPGAGNMYDLSPHLVDQAFSSLAGQRPCLPTSGKCAEVKWCHRIILNCCSTDQLRVRLGASSVCREPLPGFILHGMKGSFHQLRSDLQEQQLLAAVKPSLQSWCPAPARPDGFCIQKSTERLSKRK